MPYANQFRHQDYDAPVHADQYTLVTPTRPAALESDAYRGQLAEAGRQLAALGVTTIYLVHGTIVGEDVTGLLRELGRLVPSWAEALRQSEKQLVDQIMHDWANYHDDFVHDLESGLPTHLARPIRIRRFCWSSENHHLGRAEAALGLLTELAREEGGRVLLWGHSHAGNVFALLTHLLGGDRAVRRRFFRATARLAHGAHEGPSVWQQARETLESPSAGWRKQRHYFVTFGTPIRYGWETGGYDGLLHFVNHRPVEGLPEYQALFPPTVDQMLGTQPGDLIQQLFVAGTNFPTSLLPWRSWWTENKLGRLLQQGQRRRDLWYRLHAGRRVAADGHTCLVDYASGEDESARVLFGHAVYTTRLWLPFHLQEILAWMSGCGPAGRSASLGELPSKE